MSDESKLTEREIYMLTHERARFYLDRPFHDFRIGDIAWALAHQCRYNGHCDWFYSVAQHSVLIASKCLISYPSPARINIARWGLMHDAAEAYLGDIIAPVKRAYPKIAEVETKMQQDIAAKFKLGWPIPDEVSVVDRRMLATEMTQLFGDIDPSTDGVAGVEPYDIELQPWEHYQAYSEFRKMAERLGIERWERPKHWRC